eukprot:SAG11_NODE_19107_length_474_cov_0.693333_1_plen_67_part_10
METTSTISIFASLDPPLMDKLFEHLDRKRHGSINELDVVPLLEQLCHRQTYAKGEAVRWIHNLRKAA